MLRRNLIVGALTACSLAGVAQAQGATASSPAEFTTQAALLKPGQWVWAPDIAPAGPLLIYVDLSRQIATVYRNGVRIAVSTVSSGKPGHETPTGVFTILQKDADHHSSTYHDAPMPFQERLTWDGVALHAGGLPGYPESHGCVHLPYEFARDLFGVSRLGATVIIQGNAADHIKTIDEGVLAPLTPTGAAATPDSLDGRPFTWTPERAPSGPVTIIASKTDQLAVVLRNGVEIGRSAIQFDDPSPATHVVQLAVGADGKPHWTYVGVAGHTAEGGKPLDEAAVNRLRLPAPFYADLQAVLQPGSTVLVTAARVTDGPERQPMTIMDAVIPKP